MSLHQEYLIKAVLLTAPWSCLAAHHTDESKQTHKPHHNKPHHAPKPTHHHVKHAAKQTESDALVDDKVKKVAVRATMPPSSSSSGPPVGAVVVAVIGALVLVAAIAIVILRKRRDANKRNVRSVLEKDFEEYELDTQKAQFGVIIADRRSSHFTLNAVPSPVLSAQDEGKWLSERVSITHDTQVRLDSMDGRTSEVHRENDTVTDTIILNIGDAHSPSLLELESDVESSDDELDDHDDAPPTAPPARPAVVIETALLSADDSGAKSKESWL